MGPQSHESFQFGDSEERRRRRRQERERFLDKLRRWREERKASRTTSSLENTSGRPVTPEATPSPERRKKRLRRAALAFVGIREPRPRAQAAQTEVTRVRPESAERTEQPNLVLRASRHLLSFMRREEGRVRAAEPEQGIVKQPETRDTNVVQLSAARQRLASAARRLDGAMQTQGEAAAEAKILPFPLRAESAQSAAESEEATADAPSEYAPEPDYVENPATHLAMTPNVENAAVVMARRTAETMSYKEKAERRRGAGLGMAVAVLAVTTGLALRNRRKWKHEAQSQQKKSEELAALAVARQEQLRRNAEEIARLEHQKVDMQNTAERTQRVKRVVEVADSQTELTNQTADSLRQPSAPHLRERQPATMPRIEHTPLPVTLGRVERQANAPGVHSPEPLSAAEQYNLSQLRAESAPIQPFTSEQAVRQPTAEQTPDHKKLSKEGPTEQELSDRVERDPGRRGLVSQADAQDEQQELETHAAPIISPTSTPTTYTALPDAWRDSSAPRWRQPSRSWLIVAVVIILLIGLVLLSLTLL